MTRRGAMLQLRGQPVAELRRTCEVLDEAGCDTIFIDENFTSCAAAAALTRRARVCCLTTSRDVTAVTDAAETLDYLSDGRFVLGVGPLPADEGPYSGVAAAERLIEEVLDRVNGLPVLVASGGHGPPRLAAELAEAWLTTGRPNQVRDGMTEVRRWCAELRRTSPLGVIVLRQKGAVSSDYPDADEVVTPLTMSLSSVEAATAWLGAVTA